LKREKYLKTAEGGSKLNEFLRMQKILDENNLLKK